MRLIGFLLILFVLAAACGDDSSSTDNGSSSDDSSSGDAGADEPAAEPAPADDAGSGVAVSLSEFVVDTASSFEAGTLTFDVSSDGEFPHEFVITRGDSYDALPLLDNGAVDEEALGADVLGRTAVLDAGETATIDFDLEPGNYVFFCNIQVGPNSHAANGMVLSVAVG